MCLFYSVLVDLEQIGCLICLRCYWILSGRERYDYWYWKGGLSVLFWKWLMTFWSNWVVLDLIEWVDRVKDIICVYGRGRWCYWFQWWRKKWFCVVFGMVWRKVWFCLAVLSDGALSTVVALIEVGIKTTWVTVKLLDVFTMLAYDSVVGLRWAELFSLCMCLASDMLHLFLVWIVRISFICMYFGQALSEEEWDVRQFAHMTREHVSGERGSNFRALDIYLLCAQAVGNWGISWGWGHIQSPLLCSSLFQVYHVVDIGQRWIARLQLDDPYLHLYFVNLYTAVMRSWSFIVTGHMYVSKSVDC